MRKPALRDDGSPPVPHPPRRLFTRVAAVIRWLHIYVSLLGFASLMFFAITGVTLNHPTWFGGDVQVLTEFDGNIPTEWLQASSGAEAEQAPAGMRESEASAEADVSGEPVDESRRMDRLSIVEHLRNTHQLRGAVSEFRADEYECMVLFKGPAYAADVYIDRANGSYRGTLTTMGLVALMNDLHKGRDSGKAWSWVIDISAIVMVIVSVTGFVLILYLKRKRNSGVLTAVAGTILMVAAYWMWVP